MSKATRIKMNDGCKESKSIKDINSIHIDGQYFFKEVIHDHLKTYPGSIQVNIKPYPDLVPVTSNNGEKYVRSEPNYTPDDNLLKLPRD